MEKGINKLKKYLPAGWEAAAREKGALTRSREIKNAAELLELNLLYLTAGGSFGTTAALLNMVAEKTISKNAVYLRVKQSWQWMKWMAEELCRPNGLSMPKPL